MASRRVRVLRERRTSVSAGRDALTTHQLTGTGGNGTRFGHRFVERLNLTIRQGSAYLFRWTICHARWKERLEDHLELLHCYYKSSSDLTWR